MHSSDHGDHVSIDGLTIRTARLTLRAWSVDDASAALSIYGDDKVTRWLSPAMDRVPDEAAMARIIAAWADQCRTLEAPHGRWAVELNDTRTVIGGAALLPLPPQSTDIEAAWQLAPDHWGRGLGAEAGHGLIHYAFQAGADEVFAVVRPRNHRAAATAERIGMEWIGETEKYYGLTLQVYRARFGELDVPQLPEIPRSPA